MLAIMLAMQSAESLILLHLVLLLEFGILALVLYIGQFLCFKALRISLFSLGGMLLLVYYCIIKNCHKSESYCINCFLVIAMSNFLHLWR